MARKKAVVAEEATVDVPFEDKFDYKEDHGKSLQEIAKEVREANRAIEEESTEPEPKEEKPPVEETPPPKKEPEVVITLDDITKQAARQAKEELQAELKKIEDDRKLTDAQKEKEKEDLRYSWEKEDRTPKDYKEIAEEAEKRAFERAKKFVEERDAKALAEYQTQQKAEQDRQEQTKKATADQQKALEDGINAEVDKLINSGKLPRPTDLTNEEDPATKEYKEFFNAAIKYNQDHPDAPVKSPIEFFSLHYTPPSKQPAGADAPVSGTRTTPTEQNTEDKYVYARDHGKSLRQMAYEVNRKLRG